MSRLLAEATKAAHFAYLVFVIFGGFLAWRWPKTIGVHLGAASWGVVLIAAKTNCPLTYVEDRLRRRAGQPGLPRGFIDTYIKGVLYPARYAEQVRMLAGAVIVLSWLGAYMMRRAPRRTRPVCVATTVNERRRSLRRWRSTSGQHAVSRTNAATAHLPGEERRGQRRPKLGEPLRRRRHQP